ncbi:MAG: efflux RND transporter periplasmic adaptor subunit [Planctomycetota bacterium]
MTTTHAPRIPASPRAEPPHPASSHEHDEIGSIPPSPRASKRALFALSFTAIVAIGGVFLLGWVPRVLQSAELKHHAEERKAALPRVLAAPARQAPELVTASVHGDVQAMEETAIYPRTSGYLRKWHVDIGDEVEKGRLLAEIDAPEVAQELRQIEAALSQFRAKADHAAAGLKLAEVTLNRNKALPSNAISKQEIDQNVASLDTAKAAVAAAEADIASAMANVERVRELDAFSKVYAPFSGTIVARNIEVGQLVVPGNSMGQSLFRVAKTDPVRVFINVPQILASGVETGMQAEIIVRERPDHKFIGKVTRTARSIDPSTRTLRTEIQVPNADRALLVGSYVLVKLEVRQRNAPLLIPASALVFDASGTRVATIDAMSMVRFKQVEVNGDFGTEIGVEKGLSPTDRVVSNPGDRLSEGIKVQIDEPRK